MPFNGSGTFTRVYNWVSDAAAAIPITASRVDTEDDGIATGLSNCICKDGQTTITADLPMAGFKHTGVGNAAARTQYAVVGQIQDNTYNWVAGGGTADAITATYSPAVTSLVDGMELKFRATAANATTTPTFAPNGLTAHTITKTGGTALGGGDIAANLAEYTLRYNLANTRWELLNPSLTLPGAGTITNTMLATMAANTIKANATAGVASPTDVSLSASQLLGRGSSGNLAAITLSTSMTLLNSTTLTPIIWSHCAGFTVSSQTFTNNTTCSMTISTGQATDSANAVMYSGGTFSWAVSNGNAANGYQGGTTLPNSSTIHFYVMATNTDTTWSASFSSTSLTPTLPGSYTKYRRVVSIPTNSSGVLLAGTMIETGGGGYIYYLSTQILDVNDTALTSANRTLYTLGSLPSGIKVQPLCRYLMPSAVYAILTSPDETDVAPSTSSVTPAVPLWDMQNASAQDQSGLGISLITTNTSRQIGARASSGSGNTFAVVTRGWIDYRRA